MFFSIWYYKFNWTRTINSPINKIIHQVQKANHLYISITPTSPAHKKKPAEKRASFYVLLSFFGEYVLTSRGIAPLS